MKITKVSYGKTYNLGSFQSERIDLEASIDESVESVIDAVFQLREYCDQLHKKNNPHLSQETTQNSDSFGYEWLQKDNKYKEKVDELRKELSSNPIDNQPPKLSQEEVLAQLIEDATTLKALKWLEKPSEKYPKTKELYQNKLNQLTNK